MSSNFTDAVTGRGRDPCSERADRLAIDFFPAPANSDAASQREAEFVLSRLALTSGQHVLDAPCGNGRHATRYAAAGLLVTAVDADPKAIEVARPNAKMAGVTLVEADLFAALTLQGAPFDAAVSLYSCLGYNCLIDDDRTFLGNLRKALAPGAPLILGTANRRAVFALGATESYFEVWGATIRRHDVPHPHAGLLERRFLVVAQDGGERSVIEWRRLYDADELSALLADTGFTKITMLSGFSDTAGDPERDLHLIYLAQAR